MPPWFTQAGGNDDQFDGSQNHYSEKSTNHIANTAGKKRIYLSPCGLLNRVNFLLFDPRIHELSSLYELTKTYPENPHKEALLIGDIDYDDYIISTIRGDRDWGELLGTKQEIDSIVSTLSPFYHITRLTGKEGSEPMVRRLLAPPPAILHFATHAICYTDSIAFRI